MKISVIIPVYNAESYIGRCIESVQVQTFGDWQMILVDDGSNDNSLAICQKYAEIDDRIQVMHQVRQEIQGLPRHWESILYSSILMIMWLNITLSYYQTILRMSFLLMLKL